MSYRRLTTSSGSRSPPAPTPVQMSLSPTAMSARNLAVNGAEAEAEKPAEVEAEKPAETEAEKPAETEAEKPAEGDDKTEKTS